MVSFLTTLRWFFGFVSKYELLGKLAGKGDILDVGFAQKPNVYLHSPVGVDIQKVLKPATYRAVHVMNLNTGKLPFPDQSFDTAVVADVIEHVENPSLLLRECNRVLRAHGRLLLSTPHANYWWSILHNWFFSSFIQDSDHGEHLSNWTKLDMIRLLKLQGFCVEKVYGTELTFPLIHLKIPVLHFPMLGWILVYSSVKISSPEKAIHTFQEDGKKILVSQ